MAAVPEDHGLTRNFRRRFQAHLRLPTGVGRRVDREEFGLLRRKAPLHRRVARQVDAFLDSNTGGQWQLVHLEASVDFATGNDVAIGRAVEVESLDAVHHWAPQTMRHTNANLETALVGALVAEDDQVKRSVGRLRLGDGCS